MQLLKRPSDSPQLVPINLNNEIENTKSFEISESILRYQNTCLATKIDYQKKHISDQRRLLTEISERELKYQAFFRGLHLSWQSFFARISRVHSMLKRSGECRLQGKLISALGHLDLVFTSQSAEEVERQVSQRFGVFLKLVENVQIEVAAEYDQWTSRVSSAMEQLSHDDDNEYVRTLVRECKEVISSCHEVEGFSKNKLLHREKRVSDLDVQFAQQQIYRVQQMLSESRRENMNLTRRLRVLTDYNFKAMKTKAEEPNDGTENYECICGATQIVAYKHLIQQSFVGSSIDMDELKSIQQPQQHPDVCQSPLSSTQLTQLLQKSLRSRSIKVLPTEDCTFTLVMNISEAHDLESILKSQFNLSQKNELMSALNKRISESNVKQLEVVKELELRLRNCHEQFFNSPLYHSLYQHNQHLIEQNMQIITQLHDVQFQLNERIQMRQVEINRVRAHFENEIASVSTELGQVKSALQNKNVTEPSPFDIERFLSGLKARNQQLQQVTEAQMSELMCQQEQIKSLRSKMEQSEKKVAESAQKAQEAEQKLIALESRLPGYCLDPSFFRHQKHRDFIGELSGVVSSYAPAMTERYAELCQYLKSRDVRVAELEKKLSHIQHHELGKLKRHVDSMMEEADINQRTYEEVHRNAKLVELQLSNSSINIIVQQEIKEQSEARIIQEKIAEKALFDNEKQVLMTKLRAAEEVIRKQMAANQDLQSYITTLQTDNAKKVEYDLLDDEFDAGLKRHCEKLIAENERISIEYSSLKQKTNSSSLINTQLIRDVELSNQKIMDLQEQIKQKDDLIDSPKKLEMAKGYIILKSIDHDENVIVQKLSTIAGCSNCKINFKQVLIGKCMHLLCKECGENSVFKEQCPICKININITDVWNTKINE